MKHILSPILFCIFLTSCKSWDISQLSIPKSPVSPKLLTLDRKIEDVANTTVIVSSDEMRVFTKEVEENLIDPYGDKYGFIVLKQNILKAKGGIFIPTAVLLYTPVLLGAPFAFPKAKIEVEIRIMDSKNKLIGKYSAIGYAKNVCALYYGYSMLSVGRKVYTDALIDAFNKIRPQIQADVERLNNKLKEAGQNN